MRADDSLLFVIPAGIAVALLIAMLDHWAGSAREYPEKRNGRPKAHNLIEWLGATALVVGSFVFCARTGRVETLAAIAGPAVGLWLLSWWLYRKFRK